MTKKSDGLGAAAGLNLDNLEDMVAGLRYASEPTRLAKNLRDAARLKIMREENAKKEKK